MGHEDVEGHDHLRPQIIRHIKEEVETKICMTCIMDIGSENGIGEPSSNYMLICYVHFQVAAFSPLQLWVK